ncbi:MAG: hypothetical protein HGJ94_00970 [Desulfosarcina sp.]|nr:hypothetical protein [Desulfosarcina sp.]MBC2743983.1 hypothetical protein [Desulfosarcina sp.]MBC2766892.1 hypothetical protein [Desulfosarcina sp.]
MLKEERLRGYRAAKKNAPSFIYETLYGKQKFLPGRDVDHKQKIWQGTPVDAHIPTNALDDLNRIEEIEMRASCEGSGPEKPTFLIFRFKTPLSPEEIDKFVAGMNSIKGIHCGAEVGNMGFYRIGVTTSLWYEKDKDKFLTWWKELPLKIQVVLAVNQTLASIPSVSAESR